MAAGLSSRLWLRYPSGFYPAETGDATPGAQPARGHRVPRGLDSGLSHIPLWLIACHRRERPQASGYMACEADHRRYGYGSQAIAIAAEPYGYARPGIRLRVAPLPALPAPLPYARPLERPAATRRVRTRGAPLIRRRPPAAEYMRPLRARPYGYRHESLRLWIAALAATPRVPA